MRFTTGDSTHTTSSGYDILPLSERACPPRMSVEVTRRNLLHDARYYGLDGLVALLSESSQPSRPRLHTRVLPSLDGTSAHG